MNTPLRARAAVAFTALAGLAVLVVLVLAAVAPPSLTQSDGQRPPAGIAAAPAPPSVTPSATPSASWAAQKALAPPRAKARRTHGREGIRLASGDFLVGTWEDDAVLGEPLVIGHREGREHILYATGPEVPGAETSVATGLREGSRILRLIPALRPQVRRHEDGIDLYGGDRLEGVFLPDSGTAGPSYLLLGSLPGDVRVSVTDAGGTRRPVTGWSTSMVPGYTIFYDVGPWQPQWSPIHLAPLTVTADDGRSVEVRGRSWTD